jgi:hypothetical protein
MKIITLIFPLFSLDDIFIIGFLKRPFPPGTYFSNPKIKFNLIQKLSNSKFYSLNIQVNWIQKRSYEFTAEIQKMLPLPFK